MRHLLLVVFLCLALVMPAFSAGKTALPPVGAPDDIRAAFCDDGQVVEIRYYDYDPPDPKKWRAIGLGLVGEPDFLRAYLSTEGQSPVFIDADRDGYAESVTTWEKAAAKYQTWCGAYEQIRKGA